MAVILGSQPEHGFAQPLGLMRDCHRRIEKFLGVLQRVASETEGRPLDEEHREALTAGLRYFKNAAPWHTRDEEESLFPRMRKLNEPRVQAALADIAKLESDHDDADVRHAEVDQLGRQWLEQDQLARAEVQRLNELLEALRRMYQRHIAEEDDVIFPLAEQILSAEQVTAIGREMADRRGVDSGLPRRRCRHGRGGKTVEIA